MKKKEYMQPEMLLILLIPRQQMLAGSLTSLVDTGLEDNLELANEDASPWDDAMSRKRDDFDDESW